MNSVSKAVGYWLLIGGFLVVAMVVLGGYTRLSHSGLSMVTWKPVTGAVPPLNDLEWEKEFDQYKTSPEYQKRNHNFTVNEFKSIYWPEFLHRLLGRIIGVVFLIPFLFFLFTKKLGNRRLLFNLTVIFILGGLQGFIGWYMVKSGLVNVPSVSHYRLAIHFITALTLFVYILWTALTIFYPNSASKLNKPFIRRMLYLLLGLVVLQLIYGAFVAGLKAGLFYPTFPKMGDAWIPESVSLSLASGLKSFTESPVLIQFIHRWLAAIILLLAAGVFLRARNLGLAKEQFKSILAVLVAVGIQFSLGVITLLYLVPISLGVLHQLGAVLLLTTIVIAIYNFRNPITQ